MSGPQLFVPPPYPQTVRGCPVLPKPSCGTLHSAQVIVPHSPSQIFQRTILRAWVFFPNSLGHAVVLVTATEICALFSRHQPS